MPSKTGKLIRDDPLERYLVEIRQFPTLSREEEVAIAKKYRETGDVASAHALVTANLRLVVKIAYQFYRTGIRIMDLIQEGNIGLMQAVKEFNPYQGVRLATYAAWWIRAYIQNFILKNFSLVKIGTSQAQRKLYYRLNKEKQKLEALGIHPDVKLLSQNLDVGEKDVEMMSGRLSHRDVSLDAPIDHGDSTTTFMDIQADQSKPIDELLADKEIAKTFHEKIMDFEKTLNEKQLFIFNNRILAEEPLTLQEIGSKFKITRERARQLEANIIKKLKKFVENEMGTNLKI